MEVDPYDDPSLYTIEELGCMKRFKRVFRLVDLYALPITLRYKQEKKFYTNWGAFTSIVIILIMLGFFASYLLTMFADTSVTETNFTKLVKNKEYDQHGVFVFGFRLLDYAGDLFWQEDIISWKVITTRKVWDGSAYVEADTTYFLQPC